MLPILLGRYSTTNSVLFSPTLFGIAHFHHMIERIRTHNVPIKDAFAISFFQVSRQYTATNVFFLQCRKLMKTMLHRSSRKFRFTWWELRKKCSFQIVVKFSDYLFFCWQVKLRFCKHLLGQVEKVLQLLIILVFWRFKVFITFKFSKNLIKLKKCAEVKMRLSK